MVLDTKEERLGIFAFRHLEIKEFLYYIAHTLKWYRDEGKESVYSVCLVVFGYSTPFLSLRSWCMHS